jgi:hypothetical protein
MTTMKDPEMLNTAKIHTILYLIKMIIDQYTPVYWHYKHSVLSFIPYYTVRSISFRTDFF